MTKKRRDWKRAAAILLAIAGLVLGGLGGEQNKIVLVRAGAGTLALTLALAGWWWLDKPKGEGKVLATGCFLAALALAFFAVVPGPIVPVFRILGSVLGAL